MIYALTDGEGMAIAACLTMDGAKLLAEKYDLNVDETMVPNGMSLHVVQVFAGGRYTNSYFEHKSPACMYASGQSGLYRELYPSVGERFAEMMRKNMEPHLVRVLHDMSRIDVTHLSGSAALGCAVSDLFSSNGDSFTVSVFARNKDDAKALGLLIRESVIDSGELVRKHCLNPYGMKWRVMK